MNPRISAIMAFVDFPCVVPAAVAKATDSMLRERLQPIFKTEHPLDLTVQTMGYRMVVSASVDKIAPAMQALRAELESLQLLPSAQIGWYDPREDVYRCFHPHGGPTTEFERFHRFLMACVEQNAAGKPLMPLAALEFLNQAFRVRQAGNNP